MHSLWTTKLSCGTKSQPWRLEAPTGQQINVSLLDFGVTSAGESVNEQKFATDCHQYGYIIDKSTKNNVSICGAHNGKRNPLLRSSGNVIEITFNTFRQQQHDVETNVFLLQITGLSFVFHPFSTSD